MGITKVFKGAAGSIERLIDARRVFGEPIGSNGRIVIPVSTAWWCGGGGGGEGTVPPGEDVERDQAGTQEAFGGGFGGIGRVSPVGYIVLDDEGVRWERIVDKNMLILLGALVLLGWFRVLRFWINSKGERD